MLCRDCLNTATYLYKDKHLCFCHFVAQSQDGRYLIDTPDYTGEIYKQDFEPTRPIEVKARRWGRDKPKKCQYDWGNYYGGDK